MSETAPPASPVPARVSRRRRVFAVLLSIVPTPGAGHWLLGRWGRGLVFLGAMLVCFALVPFGGVPALAAMLSVFVVAAVDAGRVAPPAKGVPSRGIAFLCVLGFAVLGGQAAQAVRTLVAEPWTVPSTSMEPTLLRGDQFFSDKTVGAPLLRRPVERGEVIVFTGVDDPDRDFVKRVVAVGGDTVAFLNGHLILNGEPVSRGVLDDCDFVELSDRSGGCKLHLETLGTHNYLVRRSPEARAPRFPDDVEGCPQGTDAREDGCRVAEGHLFVLGDNRDSSYDSRSWGAVPLAHVKGVATSLHFSLSDSEGVRWRRIGARVP